jgi:hypothetical protein
MEGASMSVEDLAERLAQLVLADADLGVLATKLSEVLRVEILVTTLDGRERAAAMSASRRAWLAAVDMVDETGRLRVEWLGDRSVDRSSAASARAQAHEVDALPTTSSCRPERATRTTGVGGWDPTPERDPEPVTRDAVWRKGLVGAAIADQSLVLTGSFGVPSLRHDRRPPANGRTQLAPVRSERAFSERGPRYRRLSDGADSAETDPLLGAVGCPAA